MATKNTKKSKDDQTLERGARSIAVRKYLASHPKASPKVVVEALQEQGIEVSLGLVSVIKYSKVYKRRGLIPSADELLKAKRLVDRLGFEKVKVALDVLERLQ